MKKCARCEVEQPISNFYRFQRKGKRYKQGKYISAYCKVCMRTIQKEYRSREEVKKRNAIRSREWQLNNADKVREYNREYKKEWRKNPVNKLQSNISSIVSKSMKEENIYKNDSFWQIICYTIGELKEHIEKQFTEGMNWDNYGKWHLDHIKPKSLFEIKEFGDEQFMECWSLENLQPLWASDNISKGNKYEL